MIIAILYLLNLKATLFIFSWFFMVLMLDFFNVRAKNLVGRATLNNNKTRKKLNSLMFDQIWVRTFHTPWDFIFDWNTVGISATNFLCNIYVIPSWKYLEMCIQVFILLDSWLTEQLDLNYTGIYLWTKAIYSSTTESAYKHRWFRGGWKWEWERWLHGASYMRILQNPILWG